MIINFKKITDDFSTPKINAVNSLSRSTIVTSDYVPTTPSPPLNDDIMLGAGTCSPATAGLNYEQSHTQPSTDHLSQPSISSQHNDPPKWKWFHVSAITTLTTEVVSKYVSTKLGCNIRCFSLTPRNSRTFKVGVPVDMAKQLFNRNFWPIGTYVRDFQVRKNFRRRRDTTHII